MKKLCLLLAMVFALSCVPALAADGDALLGRSEEGNLSFNYCFSDGRTLYLAGYADMYTYRLGDADLTHYEFDSPVSMDEAGSFDVATLPFADGDKVYALNLITRYDENTEFQGANLVELSLANGEAAMKPVCDVDWSNMVEYYDDSSYAIRPESILGAGGKAYIRYFNAQGNYSTLAMSLTDGALEEIPALDGAFMLAPYRDGTLLAEFYSYEGDQPARFAAFDPADESVQMLGEVEVTDYSPLQGLAYDPATDTIYCAKGGEIRPLDLQAGKVGDGVTDMPMEVWSASPACVLEGGFYAFGGEGVVIRNLDPAQKASGKLKINDTSWSDSVNTAYYRFSNAHGDISVVLSREYSECLNVIESMMNRDSSVDIYLLPTSTSYYDALYNRGYLMELDGSAKANALAERMYPSVRERLTTNGHLVALPVSLSSWTLGLNEKALEALGLKLADVPDNWPDFMDFLIALPQRMTEESGVSLCYSGYTESEARFDLLSAIFEDYHRYVSYVNPGMGYNSDLLRGILEKLEQVDFVAMGCVADDEYIDENAENSYEYSETNVLMQTGIGCCIGNFYGDFTPVLMRMEAGAPAYLVLEATVAVVNPYTKNPEAALAFIDELAGDLTQSTLYCLDDSLNETIRGDVNAETVKEARTELEILRAEYEKADAADKQSLEQEISNMEANLEYYENYLWDISPRELEWYRAHDDNVVVSNYNWLYAEEAGEAVDLMTRYRDGQIGAAEMLDGIDTKVRMMMMEGN